MSSSDLSNPHRNAAAATLLNCDLNLGLIPAFNIQRSIRAIDANKAAWGEVQVIGRGDLHHLPYLVGGGECRNTGKSRGQRQNDERSPCVSYGYSLLLIASAQQRTPFFYEAEITARELIHPSFVLLAQCLGRHQLSADTDNGSARNDEIRGRLLIHSTRGD